MVREPGKKASLARAYIQVMETARGEILRRVTEKWGLIRFRRWGEGTPQDDSTASGLRGWVDSDANNQNMESSPG